MSVIWKYPLNEALVNIDAPKGSRVLHVGVDVVGVSCVWIMRPDNDETPRPVEQIQLLVVPTGHPFLSSGAQHVGTFNKSGPRGDFTYHVFQRVDPLRPSWADQ